MGEDVIWSGSPENGMLSSHRILTTATHLGDGVYGKATGTKLRYRVIADCHAINNQINDEWLIRDQGAVVRQLGWDPQKYAIDLIEREGGRDNCIKPFHPSIDKVGPYTGRGNDNEWGSKYADILNKIMSADLSVIPKEYDRAVTGFYPGEWNYIRQMVLMAFGLSYVLHFHLQFSQLIIKLGEDPMMSPRAAIRWSLTGKHDGWGAFGKPSGAEVHVMGASHVEFGPWGIRREYTLYDETSIWKQIMMKTG